MTQDMYKIGQVAAETELKPFVLRFWETEFPQLRPVRTEKGQRLYTDAHLRLIKRIKALLYDEGLTIEGARRRLEEVGGQGLGLEEICRELTAIRGLLEGKREG